MATNSELQAALAGLLPLAEQRAKSLNALVVSLEAFAKTVTPPESVEEPLKARREAAETARQAVERAQALLKEAGHGH